MPMDMGHGGQLCSLFPSLSPILHPLPVPGPDSLGPTLGPFLRQVDSGPGQLMSPDCRGFTTPTPATSLLRGKAFKAIYHAPQKFSVFSHF